MTGAPSARSASSARDELPHITSCGVPFMNRLTGSFSMISSILPRRSFVSSLIPFLSS